MKVVIHSEVYEDIKKCSRKKWYIGIKNELPGIIKFLQIKGIMPGEAPFHYVPEELKGKTFHAGINLPKCGAGKKKGPRIIYYRNLNEDLIKILYIGGHKDRIYNNSYQIVDVLESRFLSGDFNPWRF